MDITSGNSSDSSVPLLCSSSSSSSSCSEQRHQLLRTPKEEPSSAGVTERRKHSGGEFDSAEGNASSGACSAPHRASSTPSSGASLFHQQFLQQHTNGHLSASPAIVQCNGGAFSPGAFSVPMDQMNINSNATPMQAFAAAAANNIGLFCAAPTASVPQFAPSVPSGAFSLMNYGQRPPMVQQLAAVQQQQQQQQRIANSSAAATNANGRKNGSSSAIAPAASTSSSSSSSSINRSQRCGVCRGCQCKPCGQCTYCQDSPQFGGPGVKKQSCIERRCLRVLENRLQRDAPTFKARVGCNACEDCRSPDCQICLVCLDKRFFNGRYMQTTHPCVAPCGALCAKKRCNNATNLELPYPLDRSSLKRPSSDSPGGNAQQTQQYHHNHHHTQHQQQQQQVAKRQLIQQSVSNSASINSNIARILSAAQHGGRGGGGEGKGTDKYGGGNVGRTSGGNSATNSPISENGGALSDTPPSQHQMLLGAARPFWPPSAQQSAVVAHQTQPMLVPLGVPYGAPSFDQQMASLAAAAAAGFPSVQQNQHNFNNMAAYNSNNNNNNYPHKFLGYPKYEFFEEGAAAVAALGGGMATEQQVHAQHNHQQQQQATGAGVRQGAGTDNGTDSGSNPFVPPSYSAERKVVLQPL
ncbi:hypothetical protein niasHS_006737 [Heterodera schachtii]|uniref:CXXC-type domain-containing protein n=1 Tax=Heterodera schachtii TaxID=97005 RepID=A0ABD2JI50_HETSC